jgi:acetyl-CoA carboxylase biotin carboxyl carrier protein
MKPKEIQDLLDFIAQSGLEEVSIETESVKIATKKSPASVVTASTPVHQAPVAISAAAPLISAAESKVAEAPAPIASDANYKTIKSPMIGTFYRSSGPNEEAFINVGDAINEGTTVCIIEAMKLFNEIESEFSGKIVKILVQDATPVEYDQPLFLVDPA